MKGNVFNIQRYTIHDGPGVRTELFLKGCPLHCRWCSNPESLKTFSQPGVYRKKCISAKKCGACASVCPDNAVLFYRGKISGIDRTRCINCMECAEVCPGDAIKHWGKWMTAEDCMQEIRKDKGFYEKSGGGVTVSGGEPLLQSEFVREIFESCRSEKIHTCCESTMYADWEKIEMLLPVTDLWISDLKSMEPEVHKKYTGVDPARIHDNLKRLAACSAELILRIPVIPDVNDSMENMEKTADFIQNELHGQVRTLQLLSFMRLGEEKYQSLDLPYGMAEVKVNRKAFQKHVETMADYFNSRGIHCLVGTREKE